MSELTTKLERIADAGVTGIRLLPVDQAQVRQRSRTRGVVAAVAGMLHRDRGGGARGLGPPRSAAPPTAAPRRPARRRLVPGAEPRYESDLKVGDGRQRCDDLRHGRAGATSCESSSRSRRARRLRRTPTRGSKRVVGLSGESVEGRDGHVFVDGRPLDEPYLDVATERFRQRRRSPDSYFLLGDNRANSADSRRWGSVRRTEILGIALRVIAPETRAGAIAGTPR